MMTLTEFLLARIAEDEAAILDGWDSDGKARVATVWVGPEPGYTTVASDQGDDVWIADGHEVEDARHVRVLFDPARVLAECEAKRRIVEHHARDADPYDDDDGYDTCAICSSSGPEAQGWPCDTLRALAAVYADHPDYDEAWRAGA